MAIGSLLTPALFWPQSRRAITLKVGPPAVDGLDMNPKSIRNFLTGFPLLMQNVGTAAQFGLCFLIE